MSTTDVSKAEMIAYTVDKAVDDLHSFDLDNKAYMGVVRSLAFNLKRNEVRETLPRQKMTAIKKFPCRIPSMLNKYLNQFQIRAFGAI